MAQIPTTNIGMNLLQNEYGGNNPISMSEYYRKTANNGNVNNTRSIPAGYPGPVYSEYAPGANSSYNQNGSYRRMTYVNRYPYLIINGTSIFGADSGQPIGYNPNTGRQVQGSRFWYWGGTLVSYEVFDNYGSANGPNSNSPTGYIGAYGQNQYNYYIPGSYINASNGSLHGSGYGGCQNPVPSNISLSWPDPSIGPYTGNSYGPMNGTGFIPTYAMQSQVFYGLARNINPWSPGGNELVNQTVPTSATISLGNFKGQQN